MEVGGLSAEAAFGHEADKTMEGGETGVVGGLSSAGPDEQL